MMSTETLEKVVAVIANEPHSAAALTLYALVSTLEFQQAGYLFKLDKLCDLDDVQRSLAYELMEIMVRGESRNPHWQQAKARMDDLVRAG